MEINGKKGLNVVRIPIERNFSADQVVFFVGSQKFGQSMSGAALREDEMTDVSLRKIGRTQQPAAKKSRGKRSDNSQPKPLIKVASVALLVSGLGWNATTWNAVFGTIAALSLLAAVVAAIGYLISREIRKNDFAS